MRRLAIVACCLLSPALPALACHVAAKLHYEKVPAEERDKRFSELEKKWLAFNAEMDMNKIPYKLKAASPCVDGMADIFPCSNVDLLSHLPLEAIGGGNGNDNWGWTDTDTGKEYALVGRTNGVAFVDISNPETPVYLGNLPTHAGSSTWRDVKVYQNHAYVVADNNPGHGMQVFDLTQLRNVTSPPQTFSNTAHYDDFSSAHNIVINEESGFAYAVGSNDCSGGLHMIDIRNPTSPTFAGCFSDDGYTHDAQCVTYHGPDQDHQGDEICFSSNTDSLTIVNVTDKQNPVMLSRTTYDDTGYTHQGWLTRDQRTFVLDDELDESYNGTNTRTFLFDVSNLDAPTLDHLYESDMPATDHNLYVHGNFVYQANYTTGMRILDMGQGPKNVNEVAYFDTFPSSDSNSFSGAWSVYPFFDSGVAIISDMNRGLFVVRPNLDAFEGQIFDDNFETGGTGRWTKTEQKKKKAAAAKKAVAETSEAAADAPASAAPEVTKSGVKTK